MPWAVVCHAAVHNTVLLTAASLADGVLAECGWRGTVPLLSAELCQLSGHVHTPYRPLGCHSESCWRTGKVLAVGGLFGRLYLNTCELFDAGTKSWTATGSMAVARYQFQAVVLSNGNVLAAGGQGSSFMPLNSSEIYDTNSGA